MPVPPEPLSLDLSDFDAVGVASEMVVALRSHAIQVDEDAAATCSSAAGWHDVVVTARPSGHVVLSIRYRELSASRLHNVAGALDRRGWQLDEDGEGATIRFPPGTEPSTAAFELLAACTLAGAPAGVRQVTAVDGAGTPVDLHGPAPE